MMDLFQYLRDRLIPELEGQVMDDRTRILAVARASEILHQGMLAGEIEWIEPFQVVCDRSNNSMDSISLGILNIDVKLPEWYVEEYLRRMNEDQDHGEKEANPTCL